MRNGANSHNGVSNNIISGVQVRPHWSQVPLGVPNEIVRMVEVDTDLKHYNLQVSSRNSMGMAKPCTVTSLNINLMTLLCKTPEWKKYNRYTHQQMFLVNKNNNSLVSTFTKESLNAFYLGNMVIQMNDITNRETNLKEKL